MTASQTTIPQLPVFVGGLTGLEQVWFNLNGIDYRSTTGAIATLLVPSAIVPSLITASGALLFANGVFSVKTSLGAFIGTLPKASSVRPASLLWFSDIDNNAGANPYTINAFAGDLISDHGATSTSTQLSISNTRCVLLANSTVAPYTVANQWTVIFYGQ